MARHNCRSRFLDLGVLEAYRGLEGGRLPSGPTGDRGSLQHGARGAGLATCCEQLHSELQPLARLRRRQRSLVDPVSREGDAVLQGAGAEDLAIQGPAGCRRCDGGYKGKQRETEVQIRGRPISMSDQSWPVFDILVEKRGRS